MGMVRLALRTILCRSKLSGADTEVRPPRDPCSGPGPRWFLDAGPAGSPIHAARPPLHTVLCRSKLSGADTEVRPPATRDLVPGHGGSWMRAQRVLRSMRFDCPFERFSVDPSSAVRTQRSAPPRPVIWFLATVVLGCGASGFSDPCGSAAPSNGSLSIQAQRSGHRGPPPRDP